MAPDDSQSPDQQSRSTSKVGGYLRTGYLIHDVSRMRRQFYDQQSRELGITRSQWWVLFNLSRHDGAPPNQNELAASLELGSASVGELLLRLEKSGFVRRIPDPQDRRSKRVVVAERGLEVLEQMRVVARVNNARIMSGVAATEENALNDVLGRMKRNLAGLLDPETPEANDADPRVPNVTLERRRRRNRAGAA
jgi:DNA-binding MarR family transcriptional regulator